MAIKGNDGMLKKILIVGSSIVVVAAGTIAGLELSDTTYWFHKPASEVVTTAGHTSPSPQPNSSANSKSSKKNPGQPVGGNGTNTGSATDTNGQTNASTNPSQWITSKSGMITVEQPAANATLSNGALLAGTAKVSQVHFRLIDNTTGVIAQGVLNVVNGKFSGNLNFTSQGTSGQLDVFSTAPNLAEKNEIQIGVNFSQ